MRNALAHTCSACGALSWCQTAHATLLCRSVCFLASFASAVRRASLPCCRRQYVRVCAPRTWYCVIRSAPLMRCNLACGTTMCVLRFIAHMEQLQSQAVTFSGPSNSNLQRVRGVLQGGEAQGHR